jgi:hypothetical protein
MVVVPAGQYVPAGQMPEQFGVPNRVVLAKTPPGHAVQVLVPPVLYLPTGHGTALGVTAPA